MRVSLSGVLEARAYSAAWLTRTIETTSVIKAIIRTCSVIIEIRWRSELTVSETESCCDYRVVDRTVRIRV